MKHNECPSSPDGKHHHEPTCTCYQLANEPAEDCEVHTPFYQWPPKCDHCGRFFKEAA